MSTDLAEFEAYSRRTPNQCVIARHLEALKDEDRESLTAALAAARIGHSAIRKWLAARGMKVGDGSVKRHRDGECCCA